MMDRFGIENIIAQPRSGVTEDSKDFFSRKYVHLHKVDRVLLIYEVEPDWNFLTLVVDINGDAILLDGFAWGYTGEGPKGLQWLFERIGWEVPPHLLPPAHTEGVWVVHDGEVDPLPHLSGERSTGS